MARFTVHNPETAPEQSRTLLEEIQRRLGFIPNLLATLAESPSALNSYVDLAGIFEKTSLSPTEQQVVMIAASVRHGCEPCVAAHSMAARKVVKVDSEVIDALRDRTPLPDDKLSALATFVEALIDRRGMIDQATMESFLAAGYVNAQALDVIVGISLKTISNYTNLMTGGDTDKSFAAEAWQRP